MSADKFPDPEIGFKMARELLARNRRYSVDPAVDDEEPPANCRARVRCRCGRPPARPYIKRDNEYVCLICAKAIPRKPGGHPAINHCSRCGKTLPRRLLVVRKGKLYCGHCENKV